MTTPTVVLPGITVEAALTTTQPVSGAGTMTLNDLSFGILDTDFLAGADTWTDISAYVINFSISRPSSRVVGPLFQFQAGTASVTLDNSDGRFDPDNLSGPYVVSGVSQVHAMVPVRISAVWGPTRYYLFKGFADSWTESQVGYSAGYSEWVLAATDAMKILAGINLAALGSPVGASELSGARINRILNSASWYTGQGGGARFVDTGDSVLQGTSYGDTALNLMQLTADSELGQLYIDGSGAVVFRHRKALLNDTRSVVSQATFGDQPTGSTELACAVVSRADDDTTIANDIQATRVGGTLQELSDAASIATYVFPRMYTRSDLIVVGDADALQWAGWVLYIAKTGEDRFDSVTVDPAADPVNLWPQVLGLDIGTRITVVRRPPQGSSPVGPAITRDCFIAGVSHAFDVPTAAWSTVWTLQDASKYSSFFTLDNAVTGKLDHNALTF